MPLLQCLHGGPPIAVNDSPTAVGLGIGRPAANDCPLTAVRCPSQPPPRVRRTEQRPVAPPATPRSGPPRPPATE